MPRSRGTTAASRPSRPDTGDFSRCDGTGKSVNDPAFESLVLAFVPLINGSGANFSQRFAEPFALTYPFAGFPLDKPRPQLQVDWLSGYTAGVPPILNISSVDVIQIWGADKPPSRP